MMPTGPFRQQCDIAQHDVANGANAAAGGRLALAGVSALVATMSADVAKGAERAPPWRAGSEARGSPVA